MFSAAAYADSVESRRKAEARLERGLEHWSGRDEGKGSAPWRFGQVQTGNQISGQWVRFLKRGRESMIPCLALTSV